MDFTVNSKKIRDTIRDKGLKQTYIALKLGISTGSLTNKLSGKTEFTLSEAKKLAELIGIEKPALLDFFYE